MNDEQPQAPVAAPASPPPDGAARAGAMLREAREAAGIHIAALAVSLKVPTARLDALEAGRIDLLPDAVFARALAASVCRSLRIDPEPVLQQLPRTLAMPFAAEQPGAVAPFKPQSQRASRSRFASFPRPLGFSALALVVATLVLIFVPDLGIRKLVSGGAGEGAAPAPIVTSGSRPGEVIESAAPSAAPAAALAASSAQSARPVAGQPLRVASAPTVEQPAAPTVVASAPPIPDPTPSAPAAEDKDLVVIRTQSEAWVQVLDAKGTALIRKTVPAGETVRVSGSLPMRVTVGRADLTKVSVRGQPLDLAPLTKGSVARFEVK